MKASDNGSTDQGMQTATTTSVYNCFSLRPGLTSAKVGLLPGLSTAVMEAYEQVRFLFSYNVENKRQQLICRIALFLGVHGQPHAGPSEGV